MKKLQFIFAVFSLLFIIIPKEVFAHGSGLPPFFKIEEKVAGTYPLQNVGVFSSSLNIPQDIAHKNFLIGEKINFEIDEEALSIVYPPEILKKIKYKWDFGDGAKASGLKNKHVYKKTDSYILSINADYEDPNTPDQVIESVLINVIPNKDYILPNPVIKVNNERSNKKDYNILDLDFNNSLSFDASGSKAGSSKIVKYVWDFGDEKSAEGINVSHEYELPQAFATVVLRTYDENGLFSDTFVNLRNSGSNEPKSRSKNIFSNNKIVVLVSVLILLAGGFIFLKKNK